MKKKLFWLAGALVATTLYLGTTACHYDGDTAGRPRAESEELPTSTAATKEGTGDPKVGSGVGQVGTDAPPRAEENKTEIKPK